MAVTQDLVGQKFGMLTVISRADSDESGKRRWLCRCDCGAEKKQPPDASGLGDKAYRVPTNLPPTNGNGTNARTRNPSS